MSDTSVGTAAEDAEAEEGVAVGAADWAAGVGAVEGAARREHAGDDRDREGAHHQVEEVGGAGGFHDGHPTNGARQARLKGSYGRS